MTMPGSIPATIPIIAASPMSRTNRECAGCVHHKTPASFDTGVFFSKLLILLGERGGTRTLDPMIKSHVLYRLSYALTRRAV